MRALPHLGRANAHHASFDFCLAVDFRRRGRLLGEAKRITHILQPAGEANAPAQVWRLALARSAIVAPALARLRHTALKDLPHGYPLWQRLLRRLEVSLAVQVDPAHLDRVDAQRMRQPCD